MITQSRNGLQERHCSPQRMARTAYIEVNRYSTKCPRNRTGTGSCERSISRWKCGYNCGAGFPASLFLKLADGKLESQPHVTECLPGHTYFS